MEICLEVGFKCKGKLNPAPSILLRYFPNTYKKRADREAAVEHNRGRGHHLRYICDINCENVGINSRNRRSL